MRKRPNIRWRKNDTQKLVNTVRQFNAKITRTNKKLGGGLVEDILPDRISTIQLKSQIKTRRDFNRIINSYQRAIKNKNAFDVISNNQGVYTTKWELQEIQYATQRANRLAKEAEKRVNYPDRRLWNDSLEKLDYKPRKVNFNEATYSSWQKFIETTQKRSQSDYWFKRALQYQENYIRGIEKQLGQGENAKALIDYIKNLDAEFMFNNYYTETYLSFEWIYDEHFSGELRAELALRDWKALIES